MQLSEAKTALALKLDIDYSDIANNGLWTDSDLLGLIQFGVLKSWDYKPWPFTQKTKTATTIAATDYYDHPQDLMTGSIRLLKIGGKEYTKLAMESYLEYLELNPTGTEKYWAEQETYIFINQNAYTGGTDGMDLYGKKLAPNLVNASDLLPFSPVTDNSEHSGNEAIVNLAYSEALDSNKLKNPNQAEIERKKAYQTLDILWKPFADDKSKNQQIGRPMFSVPQLFQNSNNRSGTSPIGNFNL
jgi:hypothetical protein